MQRCACCQRRRRVRGPESGPFAAAPGAEAPRIAGERRRLPSQEQITQGAPVEAFAAAPDQFDEAGRGGLSVGKRVMGSPVRHAEFAAQPLEPDRVLEIEELGREARGVDIVGIEARADGAADQPRVESIRTVFHEYGALREALKTLDDERDRGRAVEGRSVDPVNAPRVRIDPIVAVHERFEAHQVLAHRERNRAKLDEVMRGLAGGLAIEGDEMERVDRRVRRWSFRRPRVDGIVERGKRLGSRRTEAR